jgi:hypothetical protein
MRAPPAITGELLPAMPLIADQVSSLVPYIFLLLVQQQDTIPDPFNAAFLPDAEHHHRTDCRSSEDPLLSLLV